MAKRSLCLLLAVATLFSLAAPAFAEEAPEEPIVTEEPVGEAAPVEEPIPVEATEEPSVEVTEEPIPVEATEVPVEVPEVTEAPEPVEEPEPVVTEEPVVETTEELAEEPEEAPPAETPADEPEPVVEIASGSCGESVQWSLDGTTLTISGEGPMADNKSSPWSKYYVENVVIEPGVTRIGDRSFDSCKSLVSISIPDSVTSIGRFALSGCSSLASVTFPASVTSLETYAFEGCKALTSVIIPGTLTNVGDDAFRACSNLRSVTISEGVTNMGNTVFMDCSSLTAVTVPGTVAGIGAFAFDGCKALESVTIGSGVTYIGLSAFHNCDALTSVTIPDTVTSIGGEAFQNCKALTSVTIPGSVTSIGMEAFEGCKALESLTISEGVTSIGEEAFRTCPMLTYVTIPASVTIIGNIAFSGCINLKSLLILNPSCNIVTSFTFFPGTTLAEKKVTVIYGYPGSTAQAYAASKGYTFKSLDEAPAPPTPKPVATPTPAPKPAAPKLSKVSNTATGVKITWKAADGAAKYRVYYKTTGGWKKAGDTAGTSYTWTKAKSGTKYTFTVKAFNSKGEAGGYDKTGKSVTYVAAPTVKVSLTADGIKVSWNKVKGAGAYRVFYKTSASGSWKKIGDTTKTSYTRKNAKLTSGKTYWFTVKCVKSKTNSTAVSGYDSAGKSVKFVQAPTVKVAKTASGIKVSWDKCAGAGAYRVFYKTSKNGKWKAIGNTTATSYTYKKAKLKNNTTYWFTVRCVKAKSGTSYVSAYDTAGKSIKYKK